MRVKQGWKGVWREGTGVTRGWGLGMGGIQWRGEGDD